MSKIDTQLETEDPNQIVVKCGIYWQFAVGFSNSDQVPIIDVERVLVIAESAQ